ncbi:RluA family pseudouridine synthase [Roseivirga pacifica]|uniref:RluA family pseudouridine synthase n=1 Tax=Roseivirga pacifica TaxID=1267423 RepID=UPI003BABB7BB
MKIKFKDLIIFENDEYLIINKPPMISSLEDRNDFYNIQKLAQEYEAGLMLCHRLDKETSGCLLLAKNEDAYRNASIQFEKRRVLKVYHAVVEGLQEWEAKTVDLPLQVLSNGKVVTSSKGKASKTTFNSLKLYKKHTLVECLPESGRMHQIRVHLAFLNAPIVNDETYGGSFLYLSQVKRNFNLKRDTEEQPLIKRFALHANSLAFKDSAGKEIKVSAPYPKDMRVLVKQLENNR